VFAVRQMIAFGAMPLGFLTAGVLAEKVFDPAFAEGAWLANLAGGVFGTGPGRGIGFLLTLMGLAVVVVSVTSWRSKPIQHLDEEVPDIDVVTHEPEPSAA
jgi:hypothetical protein